MALLKYTFLTVISALLFFSCSFSTSFKAGGKGKNIAANSILIPQFNNNSAQGPTSLGQDLTQEVREYYQSNTKLVVNSDEASDLELYGTVQDVYAKQVSGSVSNGTATQMELFLVLSVEFIDHNNEDNTTTERISQSQIYSADLTFEEAQDNILPDLKKLVIQQIFNKTVAKW